MRTSLRLTLAFLLLYSPVAHGQTVSADRFFLNAGSCIERSGTGTPEGAVTGHLCDRFIRTDGGLYTTVYVKITGTGNTGWQPLFGIGTPTTNGVLYGNGASGIGITAQGGTNTVLTANGGAPVFSATPTLTTIATTSTAAIGGGLTVGGTAVIGSNLSVNTNIVTPAGTNMALVPGAAVVLGPTNGNILPFPAYTVNLGTLSRKFLTLHAAELWVETLVAQDTIATIGGRVLVAPTTSLVLDSAAAEATLITKHNQMTTGDRVYMEAAGKVEFMAVTSGPFAGTGCTVAAGTGPSGSFCYGVTRDLDGSGSNAWNAGDALLNTGRVGDGFIDLYSVRGIISGGFGPAIVGNIRTGTTYNQFGPVWAIGNLNGLYNYGASTYGAAFGDEAATNVTVDATNGFRVRFGTTDKLVANTSGDLALTGLLSVGTSGAFSSGATAFGTGTGWWMDYNAGNPRMRVGIPGGAGFSFDTATGVFAVNAALTSVTGTIGGWALGATTLTAGSGASTVTLDSGGTNPAIAIGSATVGSAPFRVTPAGVVTATNANILGVVQATRLTAYADITTNVMTISAAGNNLGGIEASAVNGVYFQSVAGGTPSNDIQAKAGYVTVGGATLGNFHSLGHAFFDYNVTIANTLIFTAGTGVGNALLCITSAGSVYRGTATTCP